MSVDPVQNGYYHTQPVLRARLLIGTKHSWQQRDVVLSVSPESTITLVLFDFLTRDYYYYMDFSTTTTTTTTTTTLILL